jgi:hypothetical protein
LKHFDESTETGGAGDFDSSMIFGIDESIEAGSRELGED